VAASDARALATRLAQWDDDALARLLAARGISASATWADHFDAAEALLDLAQLTRALTTLSAPTVAALDEAIADGAPVARPARDTLGAVGLVGDDGIPYGAVVDARAALTRVDTGTPAAHPAESDAQTAERAFAAAAALADILQLTATAPLTRIGTGALGATDRRRLVELGAAPTAADADELIAIAELAGLIAAVERQWLVTADGLSWLGARTVERWHRVARRLRAALPPALRDARGGWIPVEQWPGALPFDPAWPGRAARLRTLVTHWALIAPDGTPPTWAIGLAAGADADEPALQELLPHEVDRVFLQNDLTAIAPGPLDPQLDRRLRSMARRESRAQASTYRFTAETIGAALTGGETAESLREFLTALSLTGLPQPLAYEIERGAAVHGSVRVGPDWSGRTRISGEQQYVQAIAVDQALRPLGLIADGDALITRASPETAFWMLADARYPVLAVGADGEARVLDRQRLAGAPAPDPSPAQTYAPLLARLRSAHSENADAAWLERELEQAVRARAVVTLIVRLPDGSDREVTVEAAGLGGGRLRGRDRAADVERTLPISSIVAVTRVDAAP